MAKGRKTGGRQKGTPNKKTVERAKLLLAHGFLPPKTSNQRQSTPEAVDAYYRSTYGLGLTDVQSMLAAQGGACAICGTPDPKHWTGRFCVDHDHATGRVRELLCIRCNALVGYIEKSRALLPAVEAYLGKHGRQTKVA